MNNNNFTVPYPVGTYLVKKENGVDHVDQVNKYILNNKGLFVVLMLDVETNPRLSTEISINDLLNKWKKDDSIRFSSNIGTLIRTDMKYDDCSVTFGKKNVRCLFKKN